MYPYTPSSGLTSSVLVTIPAATSTVNLAASTYYFYGVDYNSVSQIVASASGSGLSSGTSVPIHTYSLSNGIAVTFSGVTAGSTSTITATMTGTPLQANVPIFFNNATSYTGSFGGVYKVRALTTVTSTPAAVAKVSLNLAPKAGVGVQINAVQQLTATTNGTGVLSSTITTVAGALSKLTVATYFTAGYPPTNPTSSVLPNKILYIDVLATDANGNAVGVTGDTSVTLSISAGSLSISTATIVSGQSDTGSATSFNQIAWTAPSAVGSATITATAATLTGSKTVSIVSATPLLTVVTPTTLTTGIGSAFSGVANASAGINGNQVSAVKYSVNGGTQQSAALTTPGSANTAYSFTVLLTGPSSVNVTVYDSQGTPNAFSVLVQVPPIPAAQTFTNSSAIKQITFTGGPAAVQATFTNNGATTLTVIIVANVLNSQGAIILESTATVTIAAGANRNWIPSHSGNSTRNIQCPSHSLLDSICHTVSDHNSIRDGLEFGETR